MTKFNNTKRIYISKDKKSATVVFIVSGNRDEYTVKYRPELGDKDVYDALNDSCTDYSSFKIIGA